MPPVTMSRAPVIAALDSKGSGVIKVIHRWQSPRGRGLWKGPHGAGSREYPVGMTEFYKDTL